MPKMLMAGACVLALLVPTAASAQRGGFHGGGFHGGGGFRGGGYRGGGFRHGGWGHGYGRGYGYGYGRGFYYGGFGNPWLYGFGFGLGFGSWWAYDSFSPWFYYPASLYYDEEDDDADEELPPAPASVDPWAVESRRENGGVAPSGPGPVCGRWVWQPAMSNYRWDQGGCPPSPPSVAQGTSPAA